MNNVIQSKSANKVCSALSAKGIIWNVCKINAGVVGDNNAVPIIPLIIAIAFCFPNTP